MWICTSRKTVCKVYIKTREKDNIILEYVLDHNHEILPSLLLKRQEVVVKLENAR